MLYTSILPRAGRDEPRTRHIPSLLCSDFSYDGQSNWQVGIWAMSSPFPCAFLASSTPRLACFLAVAWTRKIGPSGTVPFATSLCPSVVHYTALLPSRDLSLRVSHRTRKEQKGSRDRYRSCALHGPDTSGATRPFPLSRCCPTTAKVAVVEESCGHFHGPVNPASHQEIRTSKKRSTDRLEIFPSTKVMAVVRS